MAVSNNGLRFAFEIWVLSPLPQNLDSSEIGVFVYTDAIKLSLSYIFRENIQINILI